MNTIFTQKRILQISIGQGFLTQSELNGLKPGDTVRSTKMAGEPADAFFNGSYLCSGEIVVMRDQVGFRVTGTIRKNLPSSSAGISSLVTEYLSTNLVLAEIEVSLHELAGITRNSIISLDTRLEPEENCTLHVCGLPLATGQLAITGAYFCIRVKSLLYAPETETDIPIRTSGYLADPERDQVKTYDLTKPDKFTLAHVLRMERIHDTFLRNCERLLPGSPLPNSIRVDQCRLGEILPVLEKRYRHVIARAASSPVRTGIKTPETEERPLKSLLEPDKPRFPIPDDIRELITMFFSSQDSIRRGIVISIREVGPFSTITNEKSIRQILFSSLRTGWSEIAAFPLDFEKMDTNPDTVKIVPEADMILYAAIGNPESPDLIVLYPYITLEPYMELLG